MIAGAFGSHGLKSRPGMTTDRQTAFMTAVHYAVYNGLGLLVISSHPRFAVHRFATPAIALGGLLFSGTIFGLTLNRDRFKALGPVTPMGGALMIAGYVALVCFLRS
ncbi:uncharacterized protein STEHIDRAFT_63389 [Stereum hirsutum FP-91666 SS1]|uniref:uncharacterized protein n=1 Tax=Stereum hirsutum (strain FP-91666) TaxID=721885 RepID=UPI0004449571|nr:uncharacterized protein STEHIDRAFT_63389 [Stereum hirsutum FP-91666 SS1]EIM83437.1 hypothetical protein STEHIDRAFT_63389 [Stereum hirsutum FP-91666 SS1]